MALFPAFLLEAPQRPFKPMGHFAGGVALDGIDDRVVDLEIIRHGNHGTGRGAHPGWAVIDDPVAHVINAGALEDIGRLKRFAQARRQPAARAVSR